MSEDIPLIRKSTDKKYFFIVNPISGGKKSRFMEKFEPFKPKFSGARVTFTEHVGHAKELATKHIIEFVVIVSVGGDGTVNEVASALVHTKTSLGVIPQGSGNGFANHLGISLKISEALTTLLNGSASLIDSITFNKNTFVNIAGIGFDGHITNLFNQSSSRGLISYIRLVIIEFFRFKEFKYKLLTENEQVSGEAFIIALANSAQYGNDFFIAPNAQLNSGVINVMLVKKPPLVMFPYFLLKVMQRKILATPYCTEIVAKKLYLSLESQKFHLDGENLEMETDKITIEVQQSSLLVIS
jgi:YegS/Rv2252/BmrU family lipid kinase